MSSQSVHPSNDNNEPTCLNCARLQQEHEQERARNLSLIQELNGRIKRLESRLKWEDKLFAIPSEHMSDGEKIIARNLPIVIHEARQRETTDSARDDGLTRVYMGDIAKRTGKSERRIGPSLQNMADNQVIKRDMQRGYNKTSGRPDNAVYLDTTPALMRAEIIALPGNERNRGHNQQHFICKGCHHEIPADKVRRVYEGTCVNCGEVNIYDMGRKEDKAFVVGDDIADNLEDWFSPPIDVNEPATITPIFPPPDRDCIVCGTRNWLWDNDASSYYCGTHQQKASA